MNNTGILKKCLEELSKETPRLDYVRGILETLIESQAPEVRLAELKSKMHETIMATPTVEMLPPMPDLAKIKAAATTEML
jgi:hypothetical protein